MSNGHYSILLYSFDTLAGTKRKITEIYEPFLRFLRWFEVPESRFKLAEQVARCGNILMTLSISVSGPELLLL